MLKKRLEELKAKLKSLEAQSIEEIGEEKLEVLSTLAFELHRSNPAKTEEYARQALALAEKLGDEDGVARCHQIIGISYVIRGDAEQGLEHSLIARDFYERTNNKMGIAYISSNIGHTYSSRGDYDKALEYLFKALSLNKELGLEVNVANNYNTIGTIYHGAGDYDKAMEYSLESLRLFDEAGTEEYLVSTYMNIGAANVGLENYEQALTFYHKALEIAEEEDDKRFTCACLHNLGDVHLLWKQHDSARDYFERSLTIAQEIEYRRLEMLNYEYLSRLYGEQEDYKESFSYYKKYIALKDEIFSEESSEKIVRLEIQHEIDKKEKESEIFRLKSVELETMVEERTSEMETEVKEHEESRRRLKHLYSVLAAIRNVNQLITHETDRDTLLQQACEKLIETRGYYSAWIVLLDENKEVLANFQAGLSGGKTPRRSVLKCSAMASDIPGVLTIDAGDKRCQGCPRSRVEYGSAEVAHLVTQLAYHDSIFGTIGVTLPPEMAHDFEEEDLFREVTGDISFALHHIEVDEKRRESEKRYRSLYDSMSEGMTVNELLYERGRAVDYRVIDVNPAFEMIAGEQWSKLVDKRATEFYGSETVPFIEIMEDVVSLQKSIAFELYYPRLKGHFHTSVFPLGEKVFATIFTDVTERKLAEEALRTSEERYRSLQANIPVGVFRTTPEGKFLSANTVLAHMLGYETVDELTSIPVADAYAFPEGRQKFINRIEEEGVVADFETQLRRKDGIVIWASLKSRAVTNENGDVVHYDGIVENIDDRKRAEEARELAHQLLLEERNMFVSGKVILFKWRNEEGWPVEYVSDNVESVFGYSVNDWTSGTISYADIIPEEDIERVGNEVRHYSESGASKFKHESYRVIRKDGKTIWLDDFTTILRDEAGNVTHYLGYVVDITEGKEAGEAMRESEERYRSIWNNSPVGIALTDRDTKITMVNSAFCRILGYQSKELNDRPLFELLAEEDDKLFSSGLNTEIHEELSNLYSGHPTELTFLKKNGEPIIVDLSIDFITDENGSLSYMIVQLSDITERRRAEKVLAESEEKYSSLVERANDGIVMIQDTMMVFVNKRVAEMCGYTVEEVIDTTFTDFVHPDELPKVLDYYKHRMAGEEVPTIYETALRHKDGRRVDVEFNVGVITYHEKPTELVFIRNITERRQAAEALRESEEFNRAINENSPVGISVRNPRGRLISANEVWKKIWAVPADEVEEDLSRQRDELELDERDSYLGRWADEVKQIYTEGGSLYIPELEVSNPRPGGALWVSQHFYSLANEVGKVERIVILTEDITEQKLTEGALKGSEDKFRNLIKAAPDGIEMLDAKGKITSCNDAHLQLLGYTREEVTGKHTTDFFTPESLVTFKKKSPLLRKTGSADAEITLVRKDGTLVSVWRKAQAIYDDGGDLIGAVSFNRNITEKKITEDALSESERIYRLLYDTVLAVAKKTELADVVAIISDQATKLLNSTFSIFFRYDSEEDYLYPLYTNAPGQVEAIMRLRLPLGSGLAGRVGKSRLGAISNYNDPERVSMPIEGTNHSVDSIQSVIAEPVLDGEELLGVLLVGVNSETYEEQDQGYMRVFARMASLVLSRALDATALSESEQIYHALYDTTLVLADENETQSVIEVIAGQAVSLLKADDCMVLLVDHEKQVLRPYYTTREEYRELFKTVEMPFGSGLSGRVAQAGVGAYSNADDTDRITVHIDGTNKGDDAKESIISVPMFDGKLVMGVLTVTKFYQSYNDDDLSRLTILARQAEIALKRSRDRKFLAASEATYRALYDTTLAITEESNLNTVIEHIVSTAKELLDSYWAVYSRFDPETRTLTPLYTNAPENSEEIMAKPIRLGEGLTGLVAQNREGMYSNYNDEERPVAHIKGTDDITSVESVIAEPVLDGDTLLGVLFVSKRSSLYTDNDLFKLRVFARLASISIKRADSLEALAVSEATYRALYETTTALAEVRDLNEVTKIMVEQSSELLNADHCTFYRLTVDGTLLEPIQSTAKSIQEQIMAFSIKMGEGLTGLTAQEGVGVIYNAGDTRPNEVLTIPGTDDTDDELESLVCEPIRSGERVVGVLTLSKLREPFTKRDQEALRIFASLASIALNQAENRQELEDSENKHRTLIEAATDGIAIIQDGIIKFVNPTTERLAGYSFEEMRGRPFLSIIAPEEQERIMDMYQRRVSGEEVPDIYETVGITRDGLRIPVEVKVALFSYESQPAMLVLIRDITERKEAEKETRKLSLAIENSPSIVMITDTHSRLEYVNPRFTEITGYTSEEVIGQNPSILNAGIQPKEIFQELWETVSSGNEWRGEIANRRKNGEIYWEAARIAPITNEKGEVISFVKLAEDITERKLVAEALQKSEELHKSLYSMLRLMADNMPDMIWAKDMENRYLFANKALCEILLNAKNTDEPIGKTDMFFAEREKTSHPDNPQWHTVGEVCAESDSLVIESRKPQRFEESGNVKGELVFFDVYKAPFWDEKENLIGTVGSIRIVTKEKQLEEKRRQAEERVRQLNEVLRAIRNVNQLITREKELQRLAEGACEMLTESRYSSAWIYLLDDRGQFESWAEAGLSGKLASLHQHLLQDKRPVSLETLFSGEVDSFVGKIFESEDDEPLTDSPDVVIALKTEGHLHGLLGVTTGYGEQPDEEELQLIGELADDLVQAIYTIKLEKAHRAGEIRYRYFADHVSDGIWAFEPSEPLELSLPTEELVNASFKAICSDCNNAYAAMFGVEKEDIIGKRLNELMPPEDEENRAYLTAFFNNDYRIDNVESREIDAEGNEHYFLNSMFAEIKDGRLIRAWGRQQDITEKRGSEIELKKRDVILEAVGRLGELLLRDVNWEANADALLKELCLAADASRVYIFENTGRDDGTRQTDQRFEWVVEGVRAELDSRELQQLSYTDAGFERWENVLQQGELIHGAVRDFPQGERDILTPQGIKSILIVPIVVGTEWWGFIGFDNCVSEEEWSVSQVEALRVAAGILGSSIGRQRMVEELRYSEERYRLVVSNSPLGIAVCDTTGKIELVNESLVKMLGSPSSEATMQINVFNFPLLQKAGISKTFRTTLETGLNFTSDHFYKSKWGKEVFVRFFLTPLKDSNQRIIGVQALVQDITEIKQAEESLIESEERLQAIFEYAPVAYFLHDLKGKLIDGNRAAEEMTGYLRDELISKSFKKLKLLSAGDIARAVKNMMKNALGKATGSVEYTINRKDGTKVPVAISAYPIKIKGKTIVLGVAMDLTERKKGEEALANYSADLEREVKLKTEELNLAERFLRSVIDGSRELITVVDADGNLEIVNQATSRATGYSEEEVQGKPVSVFYSEGDLAPMLDLQRRLADGEENIVFPVSLRCKDGSPLPVEISISPLFDTNGDFSGSVAVARDTREVAQLRKALLQSEKLASTGQLAANIAHEVNNPLTIIKNYLHLAVEELDESSQNSEILSIIGEEVERIARIINGLLSFYRPENTWMAPTNVNELIEKLLGFMRITLAKSNITIEDELQPDLPLIILTPDQLYQVLLNMVKNAQEAMPNGGTLRIATWQEKNSLHISITDTGRGIEKNDLDNIFDPFFTTKGSTGTGLGLSISYGIIKSLDGEITVTSKPGKGTTFTIILLIA